MIARPFRIACYAAPRFRVGMLQVVIRVAPEVIIAPALTDQLRRPFRDLATIGQWGAMAGLRHPPTESSMELVADGEPLGSRDLVWAYDVKKVDAGVLLVLVNIVHFIHLEIAPITDLVLCGPVVHDGQAVPEQLPVDYEPRPFPVLYEVETNQVVIDIDFRDRHDPADLEPFREAWEAWMSVAVHGAFADETYVPGKTAIFYEDELRVLSAGIGAVFDRVAIADEGFYALLAMLQKLHATVAPIAEVSLE